MTFCSLNVVITKLTKLSFLKTHKKAYSKKPFMIIVEEYDYLWEPDNLAVVLFLASESFRLWFLNMKADNLKGSGDNVSELARTAALLVVLASKFDRQLDQVSTTIIDLVTDARLADHTKIFIKVNSTYLVHKTQKQTVAAFLGHFFGNIPKP